MEHLSLEVFDLTGTGSKYATLPEDASINITDTSEIFASGDVWSHSFTLNVFANSHLFGTSGDIHGSRLHEQINKRRARLWVEGVPLFLGYLKLDDEVDVDENGDVDVTFESGQKTFEEKIEGAKANQVPMMSDVRFGIALWRKRKVRAWLHLSASAVFTNDEASDSGKVLSDTLAHGHDKGTVLFVQEGEDDGQSVQQYPRMVFPKGTFVNLSEATTDSSGHSYSSESGIFGGQRMTWQQDGDAINCLNTDTPYDDSHPYCNIALCYQRYGYERKQEDGSTQTDYSSEPEAQRGYEYMPANRVNSAPNFFVIYWVKALMKHLDIHIEENQMTGVEDLRRLFFVNTNCAYKEPKHIRGNNYDTWVNRYRFADGPSSFAVRRLVAEQLDMKSLVKKEESGFVAQSYEISEPTLSVDIPESEIPEIDRIVVKIDAVDDLTSTEKNQYQKDNRYLHDAIATSECFPDVGISEVIQALENGFGVRFLFDDNYHRVRIVLLRNVFRNDEMQTITCKVISEAKKENPIRGFRMTYGNSEDTHFYYKGFADMLPHKKELWPDNSDTHDYSQWKLDAVYANIMQKVAAFDKTCYVTPDTGNAYGVKIDKDAKRYDELHPSLFEYAGFMDAEDGDCTGDDETIKTINVGFAPAIMNDLNMEEERNNGSRQQRFALFVDDAMRPRRADLNDLPSSNQPGVKSYDDADAFYDVDKLYELHGSKGTGNMTHGNGIVAPGEFAITSDMYASQSGLRASFRKFIKYIYSGKLTVPVYANWDVTNMLIDGHINEGYRLYLQDNFEPNDDGISPIETHDWGLMLGIMRGSGSDSYVDYTADPDDGEENATWDIVPGSSVTSHPDTCDSYGNLWDYNNGIGSIDGRFSLKLRAEKPNPYFDPTKAESNTNRRYLKITNEGLRGRGLCDQFYKEYSYWIRNARVWEGTVRMELAQLLTIDKTKRVTVGDVTGFIRKMQYSVSNKTGLGEVTMEIMYI